MPAICYSEAVPYRCRGYSIQKAVAKSLGSSKTKIYKAA